MRAFILFASGLAATVAGAQPAPQPPPAPAAPAAKDFGTPRVDGGIVYLPAARIALKLPPGAKASSVGGNRFGYRVTGSYDNYVVFTEGAGTCADWEKRWRDRKFGDGDLSAKYKKFMKRPRTYDPRWHETVVTDGATVAKLCITDPAGRWVELGITGATDFERYTAEDLPGMTADIGLLLYGSPPPPAPARPSLWSLAPQSFYQARNECQMYRNSDDGRLRMLGDLQCNVAQMQEGWITGCERDNLVDCLTAGKTWSKNKEYYAAGAVYERACDTGDKPSCTEALKNYDRACKENNGNACSAAGVLRDKLK